MFHCTEIITEYYVVLWFQCFNVCILPKYIENYGFKILIFNLVKSSKNFWPEEETNCSISHEQQNQCLHITFLGRRVLVV